MKRDEGINREAFAMALATAMLALLVIMAVVPSTRSADAATSVWGDYEGAVRGAFMRSEGEAFAAVTTAVEDLPEIARDSFVKGVIVGLGLAATAPETLEGGNIKPEDQRRLRDALGGFSNADELIAEIEKRGVAKPVEAVDEGDDPVVEPDPEPVEETRDVELVQPIEPREAIGPRADLRFQDDGARTLYSVDPDGTITIPRFEMARP